MNRILSFLHKLDWRVLFAVPVLSVLLGVVNNLRVAEDRRVIWSGDRLTITEVAGAEDRGTTLSEEHPTITQVAEAENRGMTLSGERPTITEVAGADVERGAWTTNFVAATNAAAAARLPVVVIALLPGCPSCVRLHQAIQREEIKAWQKNLGWYFVMITSSGASEALTFVKNIPVHNRKPPYVGVYWRRADGMCVMRNFSAKSGLMGIPAESSLGQEWMHAVEASVPGAPGVSFVPQHGLGVQVAVKVESERFGLGRVKMSPQVDVVQPGQKVILMAKPGNGSVFAGWRYPDGRIVHTGLQLTLDDQCQAGTYRAVFRRHKSNAPKADGEEK